jgi:glucose-6-phosphate isomerase
VDAPRSARPLAGQVDVLHAALSSVGVTRVLAVTAGAVALDAAALGPGEPRLLPLDTPDAGRVADVLEGDLEALGLVVSVPPGVGRAGVDAVTALVQGALRAEGIDPVARTVAVVAPGATAPPAGTVIEGPADVHDAWTAFTPYALVPAGLAGTDVHALLDAAGEPCGHDGAENPALVLAALLAAAPEVELAGLDAAHTELVTVLRGPRPSRRRPSGRRRCGSAGGGLDPATGDGGVHLGGTPGGCAAPAPVGRGGRRVPARHRPHRPGHAGPDPPAAGVHRRRGRGPRRGLARGAATVGDALHALLSTHDGPIALHAHLDPELDASVAVLRERLARRTGPAGHLHLGAGPSAGR